MFRQPLDVVEPRITADRFGVLSHKLHAVVVFRIVARSHYDAAIHFQKAGREINFFSAALSNVVNVDTRIEQTARECRADRLTAQANIVTDYHCVRPQEFRIRASDAIRDIFVQLIGDTASYVVGFEAGESIHLHLSCDPDVAGRMARLHSL